MVECRSLSKCQLTEGRLSQFKQVPADRWNSARSWSSARRETEQCPHFKQCQPTDGTVPPLHSSWLRRAHHLASSRFLEFQHGTALECHLSSATRRLSVIQRSLEGTLLHALFWCAELIVFRFFVPACCELFTNQSKATYCENTVTRGKTGQWGPLWGSPLC